MVAALSLVSGFADGLQGDSVVGTTGNASHDAVRVHGVALGVSSGRVERGDVGASPRGR